MNERPRLRDLNLDLSEQLPPGALNAITDVDGVRVGHVTLKPDDQPHIRTGVTAILPHGNNLYETPVFAAVHTMNGYGKATGFEQVRETGTIEAPILLTNTLSVGTVLDGTYAWMVRHNAQIGTPGHSSVNVVVGECNDGYLSDMRGFHIKHEQVWQAIESAKTGAVAEGSVGAATGTACYQFKGGIGTSSRVTPTEHGGYTVGVMVQTNMGLRRHLRIMGVPVGKHLPRQSNPPTPAGSIMIVLATDAPLHPALLERLARRAPFGLARTGTICDAGSGDFAIAFTTAQTFDPQLGGNMKALSYLFTAAVEAIEEAILNGLLKATTTNGINGNTLHAIPIDRVRELLSTLAPPT